MNIANNHRMDQVTQNIGSFFTNFGDSLSSYVPEGSGVLLVIMAVVLFFTIVAIIVYTLLNKNTKQTKRDQLTIFDPTLDSLEQRRKGVNKYLEEKEVQDSKNNWVLFNFAPLTVYNAGFLGPEANGVYSPDAIRKALNIGVRCFVFHIDRYMGGAKDPKKFVAPGEPCLLYRDNNGVIRSDNCGRIDEMMNTLAQQAFSSNMPSGNDPLIVILDFKNMPDKTANQAEYITFLKNVSSQIQPLRQNFLERLGDTRFSGMENPALLFTQNFQSLNGKTLIFTNANTDVFLDPATANTPIHQNLRHWIHGQIYSLSSDTLAGDSITEVQPKGALMTIGRQTSRYFLETPPEKIKDAQLKTNNVFTLINASDAYKNHTQETVETLMNTYGAQMIPFNIFVTPEETEKYINWWGPYSWRLKPKELQYVVVRSQPPKPISIRADANGGNVAPPALRF